MPQPGTGLQAPDHLTLTLDTREHLLPNLNASILDFAAFKLPVVVPQANTPKCNHVEFFSHSVATVTSYDTLRNIPIPPKATVDALRDLAPSMMRAGHESITCAHLTQRAKRTIPLFMIDFWDEVHSLHPVQQVWRRAEERLRARRRLYEKEKGGSSNAVIQQTYDLLGITSWYGLQ